MRHLLISAGDYQFFDEPLNKGLLGGKIIASNSVTKEETFRIYKKFHTGKTNKFDVLAQLMYKVAPPQKEEEEKDEAFVEEESDNEDSSKETYVAEDISKGVIEALEKGPSCSKQIQANVDLPKLLNLLL